MSIFAKLAERRALSYVLSNYENGTDEGFLSESFNRFRSGLYKVPFEREKEVTVGAVLEEISFTFKRNRFFEFFGLGTRAYVMDQFPGVSFGKPVGVLVFRNLRRAPLFVLETESQITLNGAVFNFYDTKFLNNTSKNPFQESPSDRPEYSEDEAPDDDFIFDEAFLESVDEENTSGELVLLQNKGPLMPDFPPGNLPNPATAIFPYTPNPEGGAPYVRPPKKAVYLFYGLCFLEERRGSANDQKGYNPGAGFRGSVLALKRKFKERGYYSRAGLAAEKAPDGGKADSFSDMMKGLAKDIAKHTAYCKNSKDQLVIYINGHGYSPEFTKTGNIAMHYDTELMTVTNKKPEFISFSTLFETLASIKQISAHPKKVYLILDTCRSFRSLRGSIPASLASMHLILSDNSDQLSYAGEMAEAIREYLLVGGKSWSGLVKAAKYLPLNKFNGEKGTTAVGLTYNTDVKGCGVSIKLDFVTYVGQNIGSEFTFGMKVNSNTTFLYNKKKTSIIHPGKLESVKAGILNSLGIFKADRLVYGEKLWPPCSNTNKPNLTYEIDTMVSGVAAPIKVKGKFNVDCSSAKTTAQVVNIDVQKGQDKITLQLSFNIETRCIK